MEEIMGVLLFQMDTMPWTSRGSSLHAHKFPLPGFLFFYLYGNHINPSRQISSIGFPLKLSKWCLFSFLWPPPEPNFYTVYLIYGTNCPDLLVIFPSVHLFSPEMWYFLRAGLVTYTPVFPQQCPKHCHVQSGLVVDEINRPYFKIIMYYLCVIYNIYDDDKN